MWTRIFRTNLISRDVGLQVCLKRHLKQSSLKLVVTFITYFLRLMDLFSCVQCSLPMAYCRITVHSIVELAYV